MYIFFTLSYTKSFCVIYFSSWKFAFSWFVIVTVAKGRDLFEMNVKWSSSHECIGEVCLRFAYVCCAVLFVKI